MTLPGQPSSTLEKKTPRIADILAETDATYSEPSSDSCSSDSDAPLMRRMGLRKTTPQNTVKRVQSASFVTPIWRQDKKQKTTQHEEEANTPTMKTTSNPFKTTVKFIVGPEDEEFQVHPFLLHGLGLSSLFPVGKSTDSIRLPELDPKTFSAFVEWLYSAHMKSGEVVDTTIRYSNLIDLYSVGEKMGGGESWMRHVVKQMIELFDQTKRKIPMELTSVIYEKFPKGSQLRRLWIMFNLLGEMDGQSSDIEFLQDLSWAQRCIIRKHQPDMEYLLEQFKEARVDPSTEQEQPAASKDLCPPQSEEASQSAEQAKAKQSQQLLRSQSQSQSPPESVGSQTRAEKRAESILTTAVPTTRKSSRAKSHNNACEDLLKSFQSARPKTNTPP
ncbi:hypothetical protein FQN49_005301 [Arthroderma sp. PD_2]|nr:hypothetical protein FQN49_005301 [Arthroderma sp. PD_2]